MLFKSVIISAITLFSANGVMAAAINPGSEVDARAALTATDAYSACNCPNNCKHKYGGSCKYLQGPSTNSDSISGHCFYPNGNPSAGLECISD
ncbi:hypothetical protein SUNI508_10602 [Seiridium unicorne]|uniref:Uncharacterized protein n=1 Tax=Seiridium unicorne TaxID=138068 RepID=A0ABR2UK35_9PEZI